MTRRDYYRWSSWMGYALLAVGVFIAVAGLVGANLILIVVGVFLSAAALRMVHR